MFAASIIRRLFCSDQGTSFLKSLCRGKRNKKRAKRKAPRTVKNQNSITKKPIFRKTLEKRGRMCYNIPRAPVIRLYRSALDTFMQGYRICGTVACLFFYIIPQKTPLVNCFCENQSSPAVQNAVGFFEEVASVNYDLSVYRRTL